MCMQATTKAGGMSMSTGPDVCLFQPPGPAPPVPQPIPTMTDFAKSKKAFKKVKVMNKDAVPKGSERPDCKGHPPGMHNVKGVADASCMGKCKNNKGSGKVKIGGDKWVCQTEPQKHNGTPMNMMGVHAKGSQSKVTIMP